MFQHIQIIISVYYWGYSVFCVIFSLLLVNPPYAMATQVTSKAWWGVKSPIFAGFSPPSDSLHWRRWPSMELQPPREDNKRYCNIEFSWGF